MSKSKQHKFSKLMYITIPIILFLFSYGCSTSESLSEKVDAKGVYGEPATYLLNNVKKMITDDSFIGKTITKHSISPKKIKLDINVINAKSGRYELHSATINLRAQVILYEYATTIKGLCYSVTDLSFADPSLKNIFIYGKKINGFSEIKKNTNILRFESVIPETSLDGLEKALHWCDTYKEGLNENEIIAGYSAIISSIALHIPTQACKPVASLNYENSLDCASWFGALPKTLQINQFAYCSSSSITAEIGRCELRSKKNGLCPILKTIDGTVIDNAGKLSDLLGYASRNLSGQRLTHCPEGFSKCKTTFKNAFSREGKNNQSVALCR